MATEPKKADKVRETNGTREGRAATEAVGRAINDTSKTGTEAVKDTADVAAAATQDASRSGAELVETVSKQIAEANVELAGASAETTKHALETVPGTVAQATEHAKDATETTAHAAASAADTGRGLLAQGMKAAASWQKKFSGFGQGQQMLGATTRVLDIYRGASEKTSANARALANSYVSMGRGMQDLQKTYIQLLERAAQRAASRPMDLFRCKSLEELARVQRDMYVDSLNYTVEATGILLEAASRATQEALKPLHGGVSAG